MNFFRGFSLNTTCSFLVFSLGFVNSVLLADQLGPEHYGTLRLWAALVMLGVLFLGEWLSKGNIYVVGREREREAAINHTLLYCLVLSALLLLTAPFSLALAKVFVPSITLVQWILGVCVIAFTVLQRAGLSVFLGEDRLKPYALLPVVFIAIYLGGNLVLSQLGYLELERVMGVWVGAVGITGLAIFALFLYRGFRFRWGGRRALGQMLRIGSRGEVCLVLMFLLLKSDLFLIERFLGEKEVGVYGVATNFTDMMQRVANIASVILLAKIVRGQDDTRLSLGVGQGIFVFSLLSAVVLIFGGRLLLSVFFPLYPDAYEPLVWLLPGMLFLGFGAVFNAKLMGEGYPSITLWAPSIALAVKRGPESMVDPQARAARCRLIYFARVCVVGSTDGLLLLASKPARLAGRLRAALFWASGKADDEATTIRMKEIQSINMRSSYNKPEALEYIFNRKYDSDLRSGN